VYDLWKHCGDTRLPAAHYANVKALIDYEASRFNASGAAKMFTSYGDWCPPPAAPGGGQGGKPPGSLVSVVAFLGDLQRGIELATALGHADDAAGWTAQLATYIAEYNAAFYNAASATYGNANGEGLQTANAASLGYGLVPPANTAAVAAALANDVAVTHANHWFAGIFGMKHLHRQLAAYGYGKTAVDSLLPGDYPSFGWWFNNPFEPATTMNELPDMWQEGDGMNSRNHHMVSVHTGKEWLGI